MWVCYSLLFLLILVFALCGFAILCFVLYVFAIAFEKNIFISLLFLLIIAFAFSLCLLANTLLASHSKLFLARGEVLCSVCSHGEPVMYVYVQCWWIQWTEEQTVWWTVHMHVFCVIAFTTQSHVLSTFSHAFSHVNSAGCPGRHDWFYYTSTKCTIPDDMGCPRFLSCAQHALWFTQILPTLEYACLCWVLRTCCYT